MVKVRSPSKQIDNDADLGFTFEVQGTFKLEDGREVPNLVGKPNNPEAHRRFIEWIEKQEGKPTK